MPGIVWWTGNEMAWVIDSVQAPHYAHLSKIKQFSLKGKPLLSLHLCAHMHTHTYSPCKRTSSPMFVTTGSPLPTAGKESHQQTRSSCSSCHLPLKPSIAAQPSRALTPACYRNSPASNNVLSIFQRGMQMTFW